MRPGCCGHGLRRTREAELLRRAAARAPRAAVAGHGFLPLRKRRHRHPLRPGPPWHRPGPDRRLGRPPWQRTQALVEQEPSVRFVSMHQWPWDPGTGAAEDRGPHGTIWNVPLPPGLSAERYVGSFLGAVDAATRDWKPELVLVSAGYDSLAGDPLGGFTLELTDIDRLTREMVSRAESWCGGRLVASLEGGYVPDRLGQACVVTLEALAAGG